MSTAEDAVRYPLGVDTRDRIAVQTHVAQDYWRMFPRGNPEFVAQAFALVGHYFDGKDPEYLPIDAKYHDLEHTLQGTLAFAWLLRGRVEAGAEPVLTQETGELGLLAILLHDTGYLKRRDDAGGTGAKYTLTHVKRSCDFAERLLQARGYTLRQVHSVQHMIRCTGLGVNIGGIDFQSDEERIAGFVLGTADLLGQMAAPDYIDKLPILYEEFAESAEFNDGKGGGSPPFSSLRDLLQKTPGFWKNYVLPKVENDFLGLYHYLARPAPGGPNPYLDAIQANMARLNRFLAEKAA